MRRYPISSGRSKNYQSEVALIGYRSVRRAPFLNASRRRHAKFKAPPMIGNLLRAALLLFLFSVVACFSVAASAQTLALLGGRVYPSPDAAPLVDAVVLMSGGAITAIGSRSEVQVLNQVPSDARVIDCAGKTVVAGFWNSHVHFTQAVWKNTASA